MIHAYLQILRYSVPEIYSLEVWVIIWIECPTRFIEFIRELHSIQHLHLWGKYMQTYHKLQFCAILGCLSQSRARCIRVNESRADIFHQWYSVPHVYTEWIVVAAIGRMYKLFSKRSNFNVSISLQGWCQSDFLHDWIPDEKTENP